MSCSTGTYKENTVTITHNLNAQDNGGSKSFLPHLFFSLVAIIDLPVDDACATVRATSAAPLLRIYNINIVVRIIAASPVLLN
jgi:hypothetical protein